VCARGEAKGQDGWHWRALPGPLGHGRGPQAAYGRTAAEQRGERKQGLFCKFQKFKGLSVN